MTDQTAPDFWWRAAADKLETIDYNSLVSFISGSFEELFEQDNYLDLASKAWILSEYEGDVYDFARFLETKQRDYGCANIDKFGQYGIEVRLWDKIARYNNLTSQGRTPANESLQDTLLDIVGYVVLWYMVDNGTFSLPVSGVPRPSEREVRYAMEDEYGNEFWTEVELPFEEADRL